MLRLRTFGGLSLESDAAPLGGAALQRRRLAILSILAVARDRGVSRDKVLAYLWPEADGERARHTLSQLLHVTRRDLGAEAVLGGAGQMLRLDREVIWSDVGELEDALDAGEAERAMALYTGPFLDGWFLQDAPEYERWVEHERDRLAQRAVAALRQLAISASARADHEAAVRWYRQLATMEPLDARAATGLMTALAAAGDRGAALRHARIYEALVRQELDAQPDPAVRALADRLRDGSGVTPGTPVLAAAAPVHLPPPATPAQAPPPAAPAPQRLEAVGERPRRRRAVLSVAAGLLAVTVFGASARLLPPGNARAGGDPPHAAGAVPSRRFVAVLPFVNLGPDSANAYFSEGITEELINALARVRGLRVTARTSAFAFVNRHVGVPEIGRELRVGTVLEGSVRRSHDRVRVTAQLVDAASGYELWSDVYDRELTDVLGVQEDIARAIAAKLSGDLLPDARPAASARRPASFASYDLYLRGRYFWNQRTEASLHRSIEYYRRALALDSGYAPAYAGIADSYAILGANGFRPLAEALPPARAAADRALALDSTLSGVYATQALIHWLEWRWPAADSEFRHSIELDSSYAPARVWYALYLSGMGHDGEAIREITRARELDPLSLIVSTEQGRVLELARRYREAREAYGRALEMDSTYGTANYLLALLHIRARQLDSAGAVIARMATAGHESDLAELRGYLEAVQGDTAAARRVLADVPRAARLRYVSPYAVARIYLALGDRAHAFEWLARSYSGHASEMYALRVDPDLVPLRPDPRFAALVRRMGLN